jgi:NTP pyrophosphatase (non-canonical NTP hydrolase)
MQIKTIINYVVAELESAKKKFPKMESYDIVHQVAVMNEEAGESIKAALQLYYEKGTIEELKKELIQTGAMVFRILENL